MYKRSKVHTYDLGNAIKKTKDMMRKVMLLILLSLLLLQYLYIIIIAVARPFSAAQY
jgi:PhoPQ-activated pathogenicity-related protein